MFDLAIKGGTLVTEQGVFAADLGIEQDRIAAVAQPGSLPPARRELAVDGCLILPGAIDIHFHVRAPGHPQRGTFVTESQAAAAGGVTTILEMPISVPGCARRDILENRKRLGEAESCVNFGLYGAPGLLDRDEILGMADAGACGFKLFTHATPKGREDEFLGICLDQEDQIYRAVELVKETGLLISCHAENERLIQLFEGRVRAGGGKDGAAFVASRPPVVEAMSVAQLAVICRDVNTHVHIAHVSGAEPLAALLDAQRAGLPMTGETCPHYLAFTGEDIARLGAFALIKPPMRTVADQEALWQGLFSGALCAITTDHSPFTLEEKERGRDNIWTAAVGAPGVEALVPFVLSEALGGRMSLAWAVRLIAGQPARLFDLYPERGVVQVGSIADITIYAPEPAGTIDSSRWFTKARAIERMYHGRPCHGRVRATIVNGVLAYDGEAVVGLPGTGRFVRPRRGG